MPSSTSEKYWALIFITRRSCSQSRVCRLQSIPLHVEQPTNVAVPQAFCAAPDTRALRLRRVRIAIRVGECVVKSMIRHPENHGPLRSHRAGDSEEHLHWFGRIERAVSEIAMQPPSTPSPVIRYMTREQDDVGNPQTVADRVDDCADGSHSG